MTSKEYQAAYYQRNKARKKAQVYTPEYWRKYYAAHREERAEQSRQFSKRNRSSINKTKAVWRNKNRQKVRDWHRLYMANRRKNHILFSLRCRLSDRVTKALKRTGTPRANKTMEMVGCTLEELKVHIESQFTGGMTWDMRSKWHLDHIRPLSSFDLTDPEQQKAAIHYKNLQPLWARDNLMKHARWDARPSSSQSNPTLQTHRPFRRQRV